MNTFLFYIIIIEIKTMERQNIFISFICTCSILFFFLRTFEERHLMRRNEFKNVQRKIHLKE